MDLQSQKQIITEISSDLDQFSWSSDEQANFRCIYCGDSKKSWSKKRGWLYPSPDKTMYIFKCFNCHESTSLFGFLKDHFPVKLAEVRFADFASKNQGMSSLFKSKKTHSAATQDIVHTLDEHIKELVELQSVDTNSKASQWCQTRKLPKTRIAELFYTKSFPSFADERIVFPIHYNSKLIGYQGRSLEHSNRFKYVTKLFDKTVPSVYGFDSIDHNNTVYVVEGIIDSFFIDNCVAALCSALHSKAHRAKLDKNNTVLIFDNDYDNTEVIDAVSRAIDDCWTIGCWEYGCTYGDVNDAAVNDAWDIDKLITPKAGLAAKLWLNEWRQV